MAVFTVEKTLRLPMAPSPSYELAAGATLLWRVTSVERAWRFVAILLAGRTYRIATGKPDTYANY